MDDDMEELTATIEPMHPGRLLKDWMMSGPKERYEEVLKKTGISYAGARRYHGMSSAN